MVSVDGSEVSSNLRDRLKVGILVQNLLAEPQGTLSDSYDYTLVLELGERQEQIIWSEGAHTIPEELSALLLRLSTARS